jgi:SAM-dependent methyltransferase
MEGKKPVFEHTAHLYDLIYEGRGKDYAGESAALDELIQQRKPGARALLDVACGTGAHLRHLRERYEVVGVDLDPAMVQEAGRHLGEDAVFQADMRSLRLDRTFDAVLCLFSSIGYVRDTDELDAAVASMAAHLNPGGVLVVDGWVRPGAWRDGIWGAIETAEAEDVKVVRVSRSSRQGSLTRLEMHHLVATPEGIEHLVDHHELTLFDPGSYELAFERAGLRIEVVAGPLEDRDRYVGLRAS